MTKKRTYKYFFPKKSTCSILYFVIARLQGNRWKSLCLTVKYPNYTVEFNHVACEDICSKKGHNYEASQSSKGSGMNPTVLSKSLHYEFPQSKVNVSHYFGLLALVGQEHS